jgi:hypothetical protein
MTAAQPGFVSADSRYQSRAHPPTDKEHDPASLKCDLKYLIKSETEAYERNVLECQLSSDGALTIPFAIPRARGGAERRAESGASY